MTQKDLIPLIQSAVSSVLSGRLPPPAVTSALLSAFLSYGILAGSCITKLPQVMNIWGSQSADGLSAFSYELETYTLLVHSAYGLLNGMAFISYGEAVILALQNILILALVYKFSKASMMRAATSLGAYIAMAAAVCAGHVSLSHVKTLYEANNVVVMVSRVPQILKNFSTGSTGQLSIITYTINVVGCIARIFTSLQETGGEALVRAYLISLSLNFTLVCQILYYGRRLKGKPVAGSTAQPTKKTQ